MPSAVRRAASRRATPHRSVSSIAASSASIAASSISTKTPPVAGSFLARRFATLASVLVGAMPTETGMPVHCSTVRRSARAWLSRRRLETAEAEKGLIDRVDFEIGREAGDGAHHPRAHIAIERVIARPHDHAVGIDALPADMPGLAHGDAERLGFIRARDHAAVIVRQHDDRPAAQLRLKHALARGIEIVAVDERDRGRHGLSMRIDLVTTPQTSKARSAVTSISGKAGFSACSTIVPSRGR